MNGHDTRIGLRFPRPCKICGEVFAPISVQNTICAEPRCKAEGRRIKARRQRAGRVRKRMPKHESIPGLSYLSVEHFWQRAEYVCGALPSLAPISAGGLVCERCDFKKHRMATFWHKGDALCSFCLYNRLCYEWEITRHKSRAWIDAHRCFDQENSWRKLGSKGAFWAG